MFFSLSYQKVLLHELPGVQIFILQLIGNFVFQFFKIFLLIFMLFHGGILEILPVHDIPYLQGIHEKKHGILRNFMAGISHAF